MKLTFLDAGRLIAIGSGRSQYAQRVWDMLDDTNRTLASTSLLRMEVLPKAMFNKKAAEAEIYRAYFSSVVAWL